MECESTGEHFSILEKEDYKCNRIESCLIWTKVIWKRF